MHGGSLDDPPCPLRHLTAAGKFSPGVPAGDRAGEAGFFPPKCGPFFYGSGANLLEIETGDKFRLDFSRKISKIEQAEAFRLDGHAILPAAQVL